MMSLQCRRGVQLGQGIVHFMLEGIVRPPVIQIVTDGSHNQTQNVDLKQSAKEKVACNILQQVALSETEI